MKVPVRYLSGSLLVLWIAAPAEAQQADSAWWAAPDKAEQAGSAWSSEVTAGIAGSTRTSDSEELDSSALFGLAEIDFEAGPKSTRFNAQAFSSYHDYFSSKRHNRWSNGGLLGVTQRLTDSMSLQLRGAYATNLVTAEASETDQLDGRATLSFEPNDRNRVQLFGAVRRRHYNDNPDLPGHGFAFVGNYRLHFGKYRYAGVGLRRESNNSRNDYRDYKRWMLNGYVTAPLVGKTRIRGEMRYLNTTFDGRFVPGTTDERHNRQLVSGLQVTQPLGHKLRLIASGAYVARSSNDPAYRNDGVRGELALQARF
jgi:hypothetical protein